MARAAAGLPAGIRLSDHISLGVIAKTFPLGQVRQVLAETGRASERQRDLPAHVMVYYAVALALYMDSGTREVLRCLLEGLRWLWGAEAVRVAGKSGISQARTRLGEAPLRRLYDQVVRPVLQLPTSLTSRRGRYSCGFDLCLSPTRSLDVEGLQTAQHRGTRSGRSRQAVDSAWKDVGNCKPVTATFISHRSSDNAEAQALKHWLGGP